MHRLMRWWHQRRLKDPRFAFLFDPPPAGEAVCLDCEASHLSAKTGELLTVGAIRLRHGRLLTSSALSLKLRPQGPLSSASIRIHGLRPIDLADGLPVEEALTQLLHFLGSRPVIGYYVDFDLDLINRYLEPWLGIRLPNQRIEIATQYYHWRFGRLAHRPADLRLETILRVLDLPNLGRHDAYHDALTAGLIHLKLNALTGRGKKVSTTC